MSENAEYVVKLTPDQAATLILAIGFMYGARNERGDYKGKEHEFLSIIGSWLGSSE